MAVGNAIVQTAKFKPLSYTDWVAPLKEISAQHDADEAALEALDENASKYERYIRRNPNSAAAQQYKDFMSRIEAEVEALNQYGMTPDRRTSLLSLKRDYNRQIKPVKTAVETLDDIEKQYIKDSKKGVIGAPDIDIEYLLEHPEYTVADYKKSYTLGEDVLKYSSNLFKGLTGYDTTPIIEPSSDGKYATVYTPQGYTTQDWITAITGEGGGRVTSEMANAVKTARDYFNYDNLDEASQRQIDQILFSAASKYTKDVKASIRNAPKGHTINNKGEVVSLTKGYDPVQTSIGTVYKKNGQYFELDNEGRPTIPAKDFEDQLGHKYKQKAGGKPGEKIAAEPTVGERIMSRIPIPSNIQVEVEEEESTPTNTTSNQSTTSNKLKSVVPNNQSEGLKK